MTSGATAVELTADDRAWLSGEHGEGAALAMRLVVKMAEVARAPRLRDVTQAHIDSCLYHGQAGLDFAERLLAGGAAVGGPRNPERQLARPAPSGARAPRSTTPATRRSG